MVATLYNYINRQNTIIISTHEIIGKGVVPTGKAQADLA